MKEPKYLTIIPRARMGSESVAHEAEGRTQSSFELRAHSGDENNCFSKIQLVWSNISRIKKTLASPS